MTTFALPAVVPNTIELSLVSNTKTFVSPLSGSTQTASRTGTRWHLTMDFVNLTATNRRLMKAFLAKLDGKTHRFTAHDHSSSYAGTAVGSPLVKGASQTGNSIDTDGWTSGDTILEGDQFGLDGELKMCTSDAVADGGGNMTISFVPEIHSSPADNSSVVITDPTGIFMLIADENGWVNQPGVFSDMTIDAIEDVNA